MSWLRVCVRARATDGAHAECESVSASGRVDMTTRVSLFIISHTTLWNTRESFRAESETDIETRVASPHGPTTARSRSRSLSLWSAPSCRLSALSGSPATFAPQRGPGTHRGHNSRDDDVDLKPKPTVRYYTLPSLYRGAGGRGGGRGGAGCSPQAQRPPGSSGPYGPCRP